MAITIRYAIVADAEQLAALSRQTFYDTFAASNTKADMDKFMNGPFSATALMAEVMDTENIFLLAYLNEELAGYAKLTESNHIPGLDNIAAIEIGRLYAVRPAIGQGVGSALMKRCVEVARNRGRQLIWLGVWEHNHRAISFYTKYGFEKFGEHPFVLGNDVQTDWLMKKPL